ncbi:hypothetical protein [Larkinella sp. C7]|jgi:hypothetical protein|uniref:hypothetical protein n=1 Tax=Larkinella sp. C7 TaxID=2576607 RepID=UPI001111001E|nr:hypothetical protein [Larkinella sp. C7]
MSTIITPEDPDWLIKLVQERYAFCNPDLAQAERIHHYEQDKRLSSKDTYFSQWEEWDFEWATFKDILADEQFERYEANLKTRIRSYEESLVQEDNGKLGEIAYNQSLLTNYEKILPDFFSPRSLLKLTGLFQEESKIAFLKAEYKRYLNEMKVRLLVEHFRFARTLMPNLLKITLLQHQFDYLWPDYFYFKHRMDEPTKATANYLKGKLYHIDDKVYHFIQEKFDELKSLNQENYKKYLGERPAVGSLTYGPSTPEDLREHQLMSLLLLDENKYGWRE